MHFFTPKILAASHHVDIVVKQIKYFDNLQLEIVFQYSHLFCRYSGHRDGIWDVTYCPGLQGRPIIGTASNDKAARVWAADGKHCLLKYFGHTGSVNSIR